MGALQGIYEGARKEPNFSLHYDSQPLPTLAIESGWSEYLHRLHDDMRLWLIGGNPDVQVVFVLYWTKFAGTPQRIKGILEAWERDPTGTPYMKQQEVSY